METAKIFVNGKSQAVSLPKKYRFSGDEVFVQKLGKTVILMPKDKVWEIFLDGVNNFSEDYFSEDRGSAIEVERENL